MRKEAFVIFAYGLLLLIGGIIGHLLAGSVISLVMGALSALFLMASSAGMFKQCRAAFYSAFGLTLLLTLFFSYRFLSIGKWMPSGIMALCSLGVLSFLVFSYRKIRGNSF